MICTLSALIYPKQISASTLFKLCLNLNLNPLAFFFFFLKKKKVFICLLFFA